MAAIATDLRHARTVLCFFDKLSGVRILTTFISLKTITDGSLLSLKSDQVFEVVRFP